MGLVFGSIFGFTLGPLFMDDCQKNDHEQIKEQTLEFMWFVSWGTTALCAPLLIFYQQKPATFPSRSAREMANMNKKRQISIMDELPVLLKNKNFRHVLLVFMVTNGSMSCLGSTMNFIIEPFGFNADDASMFGAGSILVGFFSSIIIPIMI